MSRPISVREYAVLYLRKGKASGSTTLSGGNVLLNAGKHPLGGPEHTGQLPADRVSLEDADGHYTADDAEAAFDEIAETVAAHLADTADAHDATAISFTPNGTIAATDVQAAIQEVRDEAAGGSGALVLLEQHTASASASLDFTTCITSTYDEYLIEFVNVRPASANAILWMRMSTDAGSTYDTSAIYDYTSGYAYSGGVGVGASATSATKLVLMDGTSNSANYGIVGSIRLFSPLSTALYKMTTGSVMRFDNGGVLGLVLLNTLGVYRSTTAVDAFRFLMNTGNITSGTIRVYGIAK